MELLKKDNELESLKKDTKLMEIEHEQLIQKLESKNWQCIKVLQKLIIREFMTSFEEDNLMGKYGSTRREKWTNFINSQRKILYDWGFDKPEVFMNTF